MEESLSLCDLPESFLRQLCAQLPKHLQQPLRQTCRKLQQLLDAAVGVNFTWQEDRDLDHCASPRSAVLHLPGVAEHLVALNVECLGLTMDGPAAEAAHGAMNEAIAAGIQRLGQLPRLARYVCMYVCMYVCCQVNTCCVVSCDMSIIAPVKQYKTIDKICCSTS
jgi:hypothetical protein